MAIKPRLPSNETRDGSGATAASKSISETDSRRLCLIGVKVDAELRREIDTYAEANGITRSRAASEYLAIGRETLRERQGIPAGRADELLEAFEGLRAMLDTLGPATLGILRLLAHWAARSGAVKVPEDELLAEVRTVGADEWEQAIAAAERDIQSSQQDVMLEIEREWSQAVGRALSGTQARDE